MIKMSYPLRFHEKLAIIDGLPLFADVTPARKELIAALSSLIEYKKNDCIYRQGDQPDALFCVVTGRVKIYAVKDSSREDLEILNRGKYFGILSLLTGDPHSVTAEAVNDSLILKIPKKNFDKLLKDVPGIATHIGRTLSRRLKKKDSPKKVFESTIIGVHGFCDREIVSRYASSLAQGLMRQTNKETILVKAREKIESSHALYLESTIFKEKSVRDKIYQDASGINIVDVLAKDDPKRLTSLLSYLTSEYSYVIVDLGMSSNDNIIFEVMRQSDEPHIITSSKKIDIIRASRLAKRLRKVLKGLSGNIKVINTEEPRIRISFAKKRSIIGQDIFATLPASREAYSRMMHRLSREVGASMVGLALGSGAAQGLAHIGVLKIMEKENIPIDIIAGSSIGALVGALWACGMTADEMIEGARKFDELKKTIRFFDITMPRRGLIKGLEVRNFLYKYFRNMTFRDVKRPLKIIACDITSRVEVVLDEGRLVDACMASIAIPGVFEPVLMNGRLLVDGGIINPLPTNILTKFGIGKIIAVNTLPSPIDVQKSNRKDLNILDIIVNSIQSSEYILAESSAENADVVLHPVSPKVAWFEFFKSAELIRVGEIEAKRHIRDLKILTMAH